MGPGRIVEAYRYSDPQASTSAAPTLAKTANCPRHYLKLVAIAICDPGGGDGAVRFPTCFRHNNLCTMPRVSPALKRPRKFRFLKACMSDVFQIQNKFVASCHRIRRGNWTAVASPETRGGGAGSDGQARSHRRGAVN